MKLYLLRHGQTDWNLQYKVQGGTDIPLNETGIQMAKDAHDKYKDIPFDVCFVSPLTRAQVTAELVVGDRGIDIITDERLKEMSFGQYEGTESIYKKPDHPLYKFFKDPGNYTDAPTAEKIKDLYARTADFLNNTVRPLKGKYEHILVVGHGAMNLSLINQVLDVPMSDFWRHMMGNCEIIELDIE